MKKNFEECHKGEISLEDIQITAAQILVDGFDSVFDEQHMDQTTNSIMFPNGGLNFGDETKEAELVGLMESSNIPDDTVGKELLASEKKPTISESQLLRDVFDAHDLPRQFTKKLLSGMDTKVIRAISAKVTEVIPDFFDKFFAGGGVYRHSTSGKATKRDCVDGLYKVAKLHKFI